MEQDLKALMEMVKRQQKETIERFRRLNRYVRKGQILFAGSSLMEQFPIYEFLQDLKLPYTIYNRGVGGFTCTDLLEVLDECIFDLEPSVLFLNIGTNDLSMPDCTTKVLMERYAKILDQIKKRLPDTRIYLLAYYPCNLQAAMAKGTQMMMGSRTNERIKAANEGVKNLAQRYGAQYLDLNEGITDENGSLKEEYTVEGVHMYADGYMQVMEKLLPVLEKL